MRRIQEVKNGGSLEKAVLNVNRSVEEKQKNDRNYTYSELGRLIMHNQARHGQDDKKHARLADIGKNDYICR